MILRRILAVIVRRWRRAPDDPAPQFGALPYRIVDGELQVLLVTSRGRGVWIFPKGGAIAGLTPWESAAREAHEEAGVVGEIEQTPIGSYRLPVTEERPRPVVVEMFALRVTGERDAFKEQRQRQRQWAALAEARQLITHDGLADVAAALAQRERTADIGSQTQAMRVTR